MRSSTACTPARGEAYVIMSYDITIPQRRREGAPVKAFFHLFQFYLIGLMTRPDVSSPRAQGRRSFSAPTLFFPIAVAEASLRLHRLHGGTEGTPSRDLLSPIRSLAVAAI